MAGFLAGTGELFYNGITFPNQITATISITPVYDNADRAIKYVRHIISVVTVFHNDLAPHITDSTPTVDKAIPNLLYRLQQPGGVLRFENKGFGESYAINTSTQDIAFGPKPRVIEWTPIGNNRSIRIRWEVEVCILPCPLLSSSIYSVLPISITYTHSWSLNDSGLTQRHTSGVIESVTYRTPATDDAPGAIAITADQFRDHFNLTVPLGYRRESQNYALSDNRRTLTFTITDSEIPSDNPYYPGIINPQVTVSVSNMKLSMVQWNVDISGTISVAAGVPRWYAWHTFWLIVEQRVKLLKARAVLEANPNNPTQERPGDAIWISSIKFSEELFGRSMSFSCSLIASCRLDKIMEATGMWEPIRYYDSAASPVQDPMNPDGSPGLGGIGGTAPWTPLSWEAYRTYMTDNSDPEAEPPIPNTAPWSDRGHSRLAFLSSEDYIINICSDVSVSSLPYRNAQDPVVGDGGTPSYALTAGQPAPRSQNTWIAFHTSCEVIQQTNTIEHNVLANPEGINSQMSAFKIYDTGLAPVMQMPQTVPPILQTRTQTQYHVHFSGYAQRVQYPVPQVNLLAFGGQPATLIGTRRQSSTKIGNYGPYPVYLAMWDAWYSIPLAPISDTITSLPDAQSVLAAFDPANPDGNV